MPIRIVVADDHPFILDGLDQLFRGEADCEIVARCLNGEEALQAVERYRPDVLVLDVRIRERSELARKLERRADPLAELPTSVDASLLTGHVAIVGYGRVGKRIAAALREENVPFTIAEQNRELVERLREEGAHAVSGDASDPAVLIQAHVARAAMLVIATPDTLGVRKMIEVARKLNPKILIVLRTHNDEEATMLRQEHAGEVFMGEHELAKAMTQHVLLKMRGA